jgi:RNA polymerase sigma-70 factor, ECF subfamily
MTGFDVASLDECFRTLSDKRHRRGIRYHAIRAELLRRLGRDAEAVLAYEAAIARTENAAERELVRQSRQMLTAVIESVAPGIPG